MVIFPVNSKDMRVQILKKLKNGKVWEKSEMVDHLAKFNKLTMSQYSRKDPTSGRNSWDQRVKWELTWLRKRGFIKNVRLGHFEITPFGRNALDLCS
jgi:restriction endonuclease Mrr